MALDFLGYVVMSSTDIVSLSVGFRETTIENSKDPTFSWYVTVESRVISSLYNICRRGYVILVAYDNGSWLVSSEIRASFISGRLKAYTESAPHIFNIPLLLLY